MLRYKNRKMVSLIDDTFWLPGKQSSAIKQTFYYIFRQEILPYLPVASAAGQGAGPGRYRRGETG